MRYKDDTKRGPYDRYAALRISGTTWQRVLCASFLTATCADGHFSASFSRADAVLLDRGRFLAPQFNGIVRDTVDALTGAVTARSANYEARVDGSGAMVLLGPYDKKLVTNGGGGARRDAFAISQVKRILCFTYGVCIVLIDKECRVLRFDREPAPQ